MIYNPWFEKNGIDAVVVPMGVRPADYPAALAALATVANVHGALVTMPHKVTTLSLADDATPTARIAGACNALLRRADGRWLGDQFDGAGFTRGVLRKGRAIAGMRAFVAGCGGVGSAIAASLAAEGASTIGLFDPQRASAEALRDRLLAHYPALAARVLGSADPAGHDIVVNATPLGMKAGDPLPFAVERIDDGALVGEVVMSSERTPLLRAAEQRGLATQVGADMLFEMIPAYLEFFGFGSATPEALRAVAQIATDGHVIFDAPIGRHRLDERHLAAEARGDRRRRLRRHRALRKRLHQLRRRRRGGTHDGRRPRSGHRPVPALSRLRRHARPRLRGQPRPCRAQVRRHAGARRAADARVLEHVAASDRLTRRARRHNSMPWPSARRGAACASATKPWRGVASFACTVRPGRSSRRPTTRASASSSTASTPLSLDDDPVGIAAIPGERIFFLQMADAPLLDMGVLQWARHHRNFPGQGQFDLENFMAQVLRSGYAGPLSLEIFNDQFRETPNRRTSVDAMRSLLFLESRVRGRLAADATAGDELASRALRRVALFDPPAPAALGGFAFLEFGAAGATAAELAALLGRMGFARAGAHRSKAATLYRQGEIELVINAEAASPAGQRYESQGVSVRDRPRHGGAGAGRRARSRAAVGSSRRPAWRRRAAAAGDRRPGRDRRPFRAGQRGRRRTSRFHRRG